jgi:hypothetical protein
MPFDLSSACFAKPIFERSRNETTYMSMRQGANRLIVREIARFKAGSDVLRTTGGKFNAGLIPSCD